jgi:hypothetical protein
MTVLFQLAADLPVALACPPGIHISVAVTW